MNINALEPWPKLTPYKITSLNLLLFWLHWPVSGQVIKFLLIIHSQCYTYMFYIYIYSYTEQSDAVGTGNTVVRVTMWHPVSREYPVCWGHKLRWLRDEHVAVLKIADCPGKGPTEEFMPHFKGGNWHPLQTTESCPKRGFASSANTGKLSFFTAFHFSHHEVGIEIELLWSSNEMGLLKHARKTLKRVGYYKLPSPVFNSKVYMPSMSLFSNAEMKAAMGFCAFNRRHSDFDVTKN